MAADPYDLFGCPDVATEVGFITMYAANLEAFLPDAVAKMLRIKLTLATTMLGQVDNLSAKLGIVFEVAEATKGRPLSDAILAGKEKAAKAVTKRNALCHGGYGMSLGGSKLELISNATNAERRGKIRSDPIDTTELRNHAKALKDFIAAIRKHCPGNLAVFIPHPPAQDGASRDKRAQANQSAKARRKGHTSQAR